jgi:conjugal transfer pilus assembly protein TraE
MDFSYQHAQSQRVLRQRNLLGIAALVLAGAVALLLLMSATRSREIVLQPVLGSSVTLSSSGVSREYLELVTRDIAVLTLNRTPSSLDYWMKSVLAIVSPKTQGKIKADLLKIVEDQRGSSMSQYFTLEGMEIDSSEPRTFVYDWEYTGMTLKLVGFSMVQPKSRLGASM